MSHVCSVSRLPCGVCFSLTGVSPFAGENDRATALNVRGSNVAFQETMFSGLCKEAKGFIIRLLVTARLYVLPAPLRSSAFGGCRHTKMFDSNRSFL